MGYREQDAGGLVKDAHTAEVRAKKKKKKGLGRPDLLQEGESTSCRVPGTGTRRSADLG